MPRRSSTYLDRRRDQILDAALVCCSREGLHETTIEAIAREAGVSHGAIYRYFTSKSEIIRAIAERDGLVRTQRFSKSGDDAIPDALADALRGAANLQGGQLAESRRRLHAQLLAEGLRNPEINKLIGAIWADVDTSLTGVVRRGQAAGEVDDDLDPAGIAQLMIAIHTGLVMRMANEPDFDVEPSIAALRALLSAHSFAHH
jgi:AcrR family transcriptional regulator